MFCFFKIVKTSPKTALLFPKTFIFITGPHICEETDREKERKRKTETEKKRMNE